MKTLKRLTTKDLIPKFAKPEMTIDGIASYIKSCNVRGIGEKLSREIAMHYGERTFDVILENWEVLTEIKGFGVWRARGLYYAIKSRFGDELTKAQLRDNKREMEERVFFGSLGITSWTLQKIKEHFGEDAVEVVKENPYRLTEVSGIGFESADKIAHKMGYNDDDPRRVRAGITYTIEQKMQGEGHCCIPTERLKYEAAKTLNVTRELVEEQLDQNIVCEDNIEDGDMIYIPMYYRLEKSVAEKLRSFNGMKSLSPYEDCVVTSISKRHGFNFDQTDAIILALTRQVMILTGGPGTGKTTTLKGIVAAFETLGISYCMCAPTGRAAKRMEETTGHTSQTIHRLLDYHPEQGFRKNELTPIEEQVVIVDESSMIDLQLMHTLLSAIRSNGRIIFIGDADQLPSVGPGNVLRDMIRSEAIPTVRLTRIYRQADKSHIVENAHRIINGRQPVIDNSAGSDFYFDEIKAPIIESMEEACCKEIVSLVGSRLPNKLGRETEIQVICPRKQNLLTSAFSLNNQLQQVLNPNKDKGIEANEMEFRRGDRVMQLRNDYDKGVFNGDVGIVTEINRFSGSLLVKFEGIEEPIEYSQKEHDLGDLSLSYAMTIHKSQGSEYDVVVIPIMPSASFMIDRNLLYTAITRAKKICIIVGTSDALRHAVAEWFNKPRWTRLAERLKS